MSGLGKQLRGSGIAKIQNQRTPFAEGGEAEDQDYNSDESSKDYSQPHRGRQVAPDKRDKKDYRNEMKKGGRACYVQGGGAKVGDVKIKIPPYLRKGMIKMGLKKGGSANWIQGAIKKPGALRKSLGVKAGEKISASKLEAAAKKPGKLGRRARFAQTLKGLKK